MDDDLHGLTTLKRPRLLVRAARSGLVRYDRSRHLKQLLRLGQLPIPRAALAILIEEEARMEDIRRAQDGNYNVTRHVALLIALMGEARSLLAA